MRKRLIEIDPIVCALWDDYWVLVCFMLFFVCFSFCFVISVQYNKAHNRMMLRWKPNYSLENRLTPRFADGMALSVVKPTSDMVLTVLAKLLLIIHEHEFSTTSNTSVFRVINKFKHISMFHKFYIMTLGIHKYCLPHVTRQIMSSVTMNDPPRYGLPLYVIPVAA